jgi:hypothetical protein
VSGLLNSTNTTQNTKFQSYQVPCASLLTSVEISNQT